MARKCLAYILDFIVIQMSRVNCEKGYSTISRLSGNQEISEPIVLFPCPLCPFPNFRNFWLNGKRPKVMCLNLTKPIFAAAKFQPESHVNHTRFLSFHRSFVLLIMVVFHVVFQSTLFTERLVAARDLALVLVMINLDNQFFGS